MSRKSKILQHAFCILAVLVFSMSGGCNVAAYILTKLLRFVPEKEVKAQYNLKGKSIAVLVDFEDPLLAEERPRLEIELARKICLTLEARQAVGAYVDPRDFIVLKQQADFDTWSVSRIGKHLDVDIIMHLKVLEFKLKVSKASSVFQGHAEVVVSLVESQTGQQVWPHLARAHLVQADTLPKPDIDNVKVQQILTGGIAEKIARLFYSYKRSELPLRSDVD